MRKCLLFLLLAVAASCTTPAVVEPDFSAATVGNWSITYYSTPSGTATLPSNGVTGFFNIKAVTKKSISCNFGFAQNGGVVSSSTLPTFYLKLGVGKTEIYADEAASPGNMLGFFQGNHMEINQTNNVGQRTIIKAVK